MQNQRRKRKALTPALIEQIVSDRRRGASYTDIAARHSVSAGSIRNALARASAARPEQPAPERERAPASEAPPTSEELRRWLAEQVRELRADAERAREEDDRPALERANRNLVAATTLLVRATPIDAPEPPSATSERMAAAAARVRRVMGQWLDVLTSSDPGMARARETLTRDPQLVAREELALALARITRERRKPTKGELAVIELCTQIVEAPEHIVAPAPPRHPLMETVIERLRASEDPS